MKMKYLGLVMLVAVASAVAGPDPTDGLSGGVACVVPAGDGATALELARKERWVVIAVDPDPAKVTALRAKAAAAGVLGRSLYAEQGTPDRLPFADNLVDVVIATEATPQAEILRVLSPVTGRGTVGDKVLTKPALPGADDWTHRFHGPDNNPASMDAAFHLPAMLQYLALPMQTSFQGVTLVAGSRRVELTDWVTKGPDRALVAGKLRVRSQFNGLVLWEQELSKALEPDMPICAVDAGHVYLVSDNACAVRVLDMETGKELAPVVFPGDAKLRAKWIALDQGRLYALLGLPSPARPALSFLGGPDSAAIRAKQAAAGNIIVAWDLVSGRESWRHEEPVTMDYRTIAVHEGKTFFYSEKTRLACLDKDGKLVWENKEVSGLERPKGGTSLIFGSSSTLLVGPTGQLRFSLPGATEGMIFDARDGRMLWKDTARNPHNFFVGDRYHTGGNVCEAGTGKVLEKSPTVGNGCGIFTWSAGLAKGLGHVAFGVKSPCGIGTFVAGGVMSFSASQCDCWPYLRGVAGFMAADELRPEHPLEAGRAPTASVKAGTGDWPQYRGDVRRTGAATTAAGSAAQVRWIAKPDQVLPVPGGYNMQRLEWLDRPTPPVTAGGLAFYGASDGSVRAVRIADGKTSWTFWTGGAVLTSPSFANGRVYVAGGDGWVYCLDAATGQLVWRWRGAPADRRIMIYGKLMSSWPVTALLVNEGVVYGVAGQWMQNGVVTFALDTATGKEKWLHWTDPYNDSLDYLQRDDPGFGPAGQLALVGNNLWVRTYMGVPAIFETATGKRVPDASDLRQFQKRHWWNFGCWFTTAGQDILVVDDHLVLQGGAPLLGNPDMRIDRSAGKFIAYRVNDDGAVPGLPHPPRAIPNSQIAPALAGEDLVLVGGLAKGNPTVGVSAWSLAKWRGQLPAMGAPDTSRVAGDKTNPFNAQTPPTSLDMNEARWRAADLDVNAVVLATDAVMAAVGEHKPHGPLKWGEHPGFAGWKLVAFDRVTGKERWSVALPAEPIFNGLAPAADGTVIVTLRDGSVVAVK